MIINFKVKNFRSYADQAELSFKAQPGEVDSAGVTNITLDDNSEVHLLNVIAIFGANASGKSNVINALKTLSDMVANSLSYKVADGLPGWMPYFTPDMNQKPIETSIDFIAGQSRYVYNLAIGNLGVIDEELLIYIKDTPRQVFKRALGFDDAGKPNGYKLAFGEGWLSTTLDLSDMNILSNQLMLSWLATKEANGLQRVSEYLGSLSIVTPESLPSTGQQLTTIAENIFKLKDGINQSPLFRRFTKVMRIADLGVTDAYMARHDDSDFQFPSSVPNEVQRAFIDDNRWEFNLIHTTGEGDDTVRLPLRFESQGTQALIKLAPRMLYALESGSFLAYDEINTAIHPAMFKFLVNLFQNKRSNPKGAQLLFTTHDASIAGDNTLRADQIWFAEKKDGKSELFSAQDFEDVAIQGIPFESWYRAGRFGALPSFGNVDYIFAEDGEEIKK